MFRTVGKLRPSWCVAIAGILLSVMFTTFIWGSLPMRVQASVNAEPDAGITATYTVSNTNDDGVGSLRQAIAQANASAGPDTITFNIPGAGPHTIQLLSTLPPISDTLSIDGSTEPDFAGAPIIELDGSQTGVEANGLHLTQGASGITIRGLVINRFSENGILLDGSNFNTIAGNYLGADVTGVVDLGNRDGIHLQNGSAANLIGGQTPADRNVISGNNSDSIDLNDPGTWGNLIVGNYVGPDATGTKYITDPALGENSDGVDLDDAVTYNIVANNLISGISDDAVPISEPGTLYNLIVDNRIGTDATGTAALPNIDDGLAIDENAGESVVAFNLISGNISDAVEIQDPGAVRNIIVGNLLGTDVTGTKPLGNGTDGVDIDAGATGNIVTHNVIASNGEAAVEINDPETRNNIITGNMLGADATGTLQLGNAGDGVIIKDSASGNIIGGRSGPNTEILDRMITFADDVDLGPQRDLYLQIVNDTRTRISNLSRDYTGNVIRHNGGAGVLVVNDPELTVDGVGNFILDNSIANNSKLGIDLGEDGVTLNDLGDADTGPNNLQNFPVLTSVITTSNGVTIAGTLNSIPNTTFRIEGFSSLPANAPQLGDGQTLLGAVEIRTDNNGDAAFQLATLIAIPNGHVIVATATNLSTNDTSEFS
ncbi:MAG: hypothetical protein MI924_26040, partial [Chloroflexales bacterium]|nr:hypothetical protein [Chloroflexales bacterium]